MEMLIEQQRTNELLEKLIVVQLSNQGVSQKQIAKFLGKRAQTITQMLQMVKSA
jgi:transposase